MAREYATPQPAWFVDVTQPATTVRHKVLGSANRELLEREARDQGRTVVVVAETEVASLEAFNAWEEPE